MTASIEAHALTVTSPESDEVRLERVNSLNLDPDQINRCLVMYRDDSIFLVSGRVSRGRLYASFRTFEYPHSKNVIKHCTRTHAVEFITQASYVLVGNLHHLDPNWMLSQDEFLKLALDEQTTFTEMQIRFRKFIPNEDGIELEIWLKQFRYINQRLYLSLGFLFPAGCSGSCEAMIALDYTLHPGSSTG